MKCFITGSTGFVGTALCEQLTKHSHQVCGLVHDLHSKQELSCEHEICFGDIRNFKRMREILLGKKPDAIIHLAAQATVSQAAVNPISTYETNVSGTINLLEAWKEACPNSSHFLHFSTDKVYGNGLNKKESDPVVATYDPYQASKVTADIIAQAYGATVTRSCNIYGPRDRESSRLVPDVIQGYLRGEEPHLRHPEARREWIYVDDVCKLVAWLVEQRKSGIWNLGSGQVLSVYDVAKEIHKHFPKIMSYSTYAAAKYAELESQSLDTSKLCGEMDCLAFTTLQAGIRKTVEFWKQEQTHQSSSYAVA